MSEEAKRLSLDIKLMPIGKGYCIPRNDSVVIRDAETGERISGIQSITLMLSPDDIVRALIMVPVSRLDADLEAPAEIKIITEGEK